MRTLTARSLTKVLPSSSCFSVPRALLANIFFNSTSFGRRSSSRNCDDCFAEQNSTKLGAEGGIHASIYKWVYSAREEHQKGTKQLDVTWNDNIRSEALYHHNDPKWNPTQCEGEHNNGERFGKLDLFDSQSIFSALGVGRRSHV